MLTDEFYSSVSSFVTTLQSPDGEIDALQLPAPPKKSEWSG